jgi:hypothetical protein
MIKQITMLLSFIWLFVACTDDHPDVSGKTLVRYQLNTQQIEGDPETDFARVVDFNDLNLREVFIHSTDTTGNRVLDLKFTMPINQEGSFHFIGSLEESDAYATFSQVDDTFNYTEYIAPYSNALAGTVTVVRNTNSRIAGSFTVQLKDVEENEPFLLITNGEFEVRY